MYLLEFVVMNMADQEQLENFQMPVGIRQLILPPIGGSNYALVVSYSDQPEEVLNSILLRDKLQNEGWNVEFLCCGDSTLANVRAGLDWLKGVNGIRLLIFKNDHSIIATGKPWWGTYTFEDGTMSYAEFDGHLSQIVGNFTGERALFVTGPKSGSSAECDHSIWTDPANGGLVLCSTDENNDFGGLADPCDLAALWLGGDDTFENAWIKHQLAEPSARRNP